MAAFEYEALDPVGRIKKGVINADTARLARRELRQIKLVPVKLEPAAKAQSPAVAWMANWRKPHVGSSAVMLMTRQLATMVSAAAPIEEAVQAIAMQTEHKALQKTLFAVRAAVTEGARLSEAMAQHSHVFSPLYVALVSAGEASGTLALILERLADHLEKADRLRVKIVTALIYPAVLAAVAMAVVTLLLVYVVPKVVEQFASLGQDLPLLTQVLIGLSSGLQNYGVFALIIACGGAVWLARMWKVPAARRRIEIQLLRLPLIGRVIRQHQATRLARTLATLFTAGVPALEALAAAKATLTSTVLAEGVAAVIAAVHEGGSLSGALRAANVFPPIVSYMAASGENSGRLDVMLDKAADQMEREVEATTTVAVGLLEPGIIVIMGAIVAIIVMAILMPIFQLNTLALK